ncbi:hypothetical protein VE01_04504 [Pseudogymnoascus verrucosus]|uniref:Uncharacterized protein n=1 Tax=Pseudogymnoascus verrucosus TaxID=342668 RepID=A0A1B8GNY0_9PEZI|nr:uncharacterized protein VE01_04504 [Pseudogymnoascus verrucosus]OBT97545.1 hypothetical protein VE01_04504 [Pseudogymnoascus verrucosus]
MSAHGGSGGQFEPVKEKQAQPLPGSERAMKPTSESTALEGSEGFVEYVGSGKLKDKKVLITGGEYSSGYHIWSRRFAYFVTANILQMFAVTKFALPHMKKGSAIINTTSTVAFRGTPDMVDYAATKGAIVSFTKALAKHLMPKGIRVNAVAPGPVHTPLQPASRPAEQMEGFGKKSGIGRPG